MTDPRDVVSARHAEYQLGQLARKGATRKLTEKEQENAARYRRIIQDAKTNRWRDEPSD